MKQHTYLIKWKGYNSHESSWEPESNLTNAEEGLDDYKRCRNIQWRQQTGCTYITPCSCIHTNLHHQTRYHTPLQMHYNLLNWCQKTTMNRKLDLLATNWTTRLYQNGAEPVNFTMEQSSCIDHLLGHIESRDNGNSMCYHAANQREWVTIIEFLKEEHAHIKTLKQLFKMANDNATELHLLFEDSPVNNNVNWGVTSHHHITPFLILSSHGWFFYYVSILQDASWTPHGS